VQEFEGNPMKWPDLDSPVFADDPPPSSNPQKPDVDLLLWAYGHGLFPMAETRGKRKRIDWFCPDPRGVIPLEQPDAFHVPKNLDKEVRRRKFSIRSDTAFAEVIRNCAGARSKENQSWHTDDLIEAYVGLHRAGFAHSVEAWSGDQLVGGLYGVAIGGAYFGESMFSRPALGGSNSSKVCLVHLVRWLRHRGYTLLDTQFANEHLMQFGVVEIPAEAYLNNLYTAIRQPVTWGEFKPL